MLLLYLFLVSLIIYLLLATVYLLVLAIAYFVVPEPKSNKSGVLNRFALLVPAHNEELLIARLCDSLLKIDYPQGHFQIYIVADNCTDNTAKISRFFPIQVLERKDRIHTGKGYAIEWALRQISLSNFDAVLILDADNVVDPLIIKELNQKINQGELAIQCHNAVGNSNDSWFTQLLYVSRTIGNALYHHSKYKLGLSSYLMGNGICFTTKLLESKNWTAFTVGEDWEYYTQLIADRIIISFAINAKVFHQESRSLKQATTQRLRWSSGRFLVLKNYGLKLFWDGLKRRDFITLDASLPLIFPNYSLQINLTFLALLLSLFLRRSYVKSVLLIVSSILLIGQFALFLIGICLTKSYKKSFVAILHAPFFLAWKAIIDILSFTGLYREKKWIRTERHIS